MEMTLFISAWNQCVMIIIFGVFAAKAFSVPLLGAVV